MTRIANLGFPRQGAQRELKWALERAWKTNDYAELLTDAQSLRHRHWQLQIDAGVDSVPVGDFSLYDPMLDLAIALGVVPARFGGVAFDPTDPGELSRYFAMARGGLLDGDEVAPLEMTKWFDTNYHQLVPELDPQQHFEANPAWYLEQLVDAMSMGVPARVTLIGPVTFLARSKRVDGGDPLELADSMQDAYHELVRAMFEAGAREFAFSEPILVTDLTGPARDASGRLYQTITEGFADAMLTIEAPYGALGENASLAFDLPVNVVHVDLVRGAEQLSAVLAARSQHMGLSLGVVDGRNIWTSDLDAVVATVQHAIDAIGADNVTIAPSCTLAHLPFDSASETDLDDELRSWLAFAVQRLDELRVVARVVDGDEATVANELRANRMANQTRRSSQRVHNRAVTDRLAHVTAASAQRPSPYPQRARIQHRELGLPVLPTTTIGSFPQTAQIRSLRKAWRSASIDTETYESGLREAIDETIEFQEEIGLDVLVHGEFERTDMVEYFGEQLSGFATTRNGWVQSYGSRGVKPPIIFGDVARSHPMTLDWTLYAAKQTAKPMKAMLTGPVTILAWSFVRDDQPEAKTAQQVAFALRDEVDDLVGAGIRVIQIDEPALREGLPLRADDRAVYLQWATEAFRLAAGSAPDGVQIHTHMCYADFSDIIDAIVDMDADVISMEASRSDMELLHDFAATNYPNEIGPGIWDIHSTRVPSGDELDALLDQAVARFGVERLWVNPDCGLKTRGWPETKASLKNLVDAAHRARLRCADVNG